MTAEIQSIIRELKLVMNGEPWFGQSVDAIFKTIDSKNVYKKPGKNAHSLIQLLYHMINWAEFTLAQITDKATDVSFFEKNDWIDINSTEHSWEKGSQLLNTIHQEIVRALENKHDDFLDEVVSYRQYDFRFLLNGLIQHDIYHLGQIAYLNKLLAAE